MFADNLGLVLFVPVTAANVRDRDGAKTLPGCLAQTLKRLRLVLAGAASSA